MQLILAQRELCSVKAYALLFSISNVLYPTTEMNILG